MPVETRSVATLTLTGRLIKTKGVTLYFALGALALLVSAAAVRGTWTWIATPSLNLPVVEDLTLRATVGFWAQTRDGDRLLAVNGVPVTSVSQVKAMEKTLSPGPVTARFARGTTEFELTGELARPRPAHALALTARCLAGIAFFLIGGATFLVRPGTRVTWLFLLTCFASGVVLLSILMLRDDVFLRNMVPNSALVLAAGLQLQFFAEFPRRARLLDRRPWLAFAPHLPTLILVPALFGRIQLAGQTKARAGQTQDVVVILIFLWCMSAVLGILTLLRAQYRDARRAMDVRAQAQVRAMTVAITVGMLLPALWTMAWAFGLIAFPGVVHFGTVPFVLFAGVVGHSLVRHNAFDVDRFTARVAGYAAALVVLGLCFVVALVGMPLLLGRLGIPRSPELFVVLTSLAFVTFLPLFNRLKARIDTWFMRSGVDATKQADALRHLSFTIQTGERERGMKAALSAARTVDADRAEYWALDGSGRQFTLAASDGADSPNAKDPSKATLTREGALGATLSGLDGAAGVAGLSEKLLPPAAQLELWGKELAVAVPVKVHGSLVGFLGVGRKLSGAAFVPAEAAFLSAVATSLGIVVEQAQQESTRIGRYRLGKRLGTGGMAEVYLAWQLGPGGFERKVALKRPLPHLVDDTAAIGMFLDEARISAQLSHRNIVTIHEVDRQDGHYLIAMEYVDGATVRTAVKWSSERGHPIPLGVALRIGVGLLNALAYAHAATDASGKPLGLVHRDVTPANLIVSTSGEVKLMDFGIARAAERHTATRTGSVKGTIPFMSPEQASGLFVDARSDLYSAGATLYELFTLVRAFPEGPKGHRPLPPSELRTDLPPELDAFFARALAFHADERPASAKQMLQELLRAASPLEPVSDDAVARWIEGLAAESGTVPEAKVSATEATVSVPAPRQTLS